MHTLDAIDRKILRLLQSDSRTTMQELADKVGLSVSPCHRRVKLLEERGVITRYIATVDQKSLGLHVSVFISIKLARQKEEDLDRFAKAISKWDEVLECYLMTGNRDYLLRVVAADLSSYEAFLKNKLTRLDGIASIEFELCAEPGEIFDRAAGVRVLSSRRRSSRRALICWALRFTTIVMPAKAAYPVRLSLSFNHRRLGILNRPLSRAMTARYTSAFPRRDFARVVA